MHLEEVPHHEATIFGQDTLWVKLHTLHNVFLVSHTHNDFLHFGVFVRGYRSGDLEAVRERSVGASERMIACDGDILRDACKDAFAVVFERRCFSVQDLACHVYRTAVAIEDALSAPR